MKKFVVIGLGNFGLNLSRTLMENGCEVLGIDSDRETVQRAKDTVTHAVIGNATNRSVLQSLPIKDFDGAVVSIGQELAASILISLYLKEIGIKRIVVRAISEDHEKILRMQGVSDIIFPERDMAMRFGTILARRNVIDYLPLTGDYVIMDVTPPKSFIGKTIRELQIGSRFSCQILGIRYTGEEGTKIAPLADTVIPADSVMIMLGRESDIDRIQREG
ncbi:MAG TPA: TrkA family potassium uptake protein [Spirochaetota bacterium]|nr:TrkA family potassium uptake protein [Spirochaetota bacterium]HPI90530.1 TrkA family potassium uptake protein [Spirochaetota bacterium]HPR47870.1 TrkA family potassium uptake protein [Spirochaetota bacterium]